MLPGNYHKCVEKDKVIKYELDVVHLDVDLFGGNGAHSLPNGVREKSASEIKMCWNDLLLSHVSKQFTR